MASNYWAKLWIEMLHDRKTAALPDNLWRRFVECILLAKELDSGGMLPPIEDISWVTRVETETLESEFDALSRRGLLDYRADSPLDGHWFVTNYDKRQGSMSGAERISRWRETQKRRDYNDTCNTSVTKRYTEEESESEEESDSENETKFSELLTAFEKASGIPEITMTGQDVKTIKEWCSAGYSGEDVTLAIEQMLDRHYTIVRASSINNALKIVQTNKKMKEPLSLEDQLERAGYK